MSLLKTMGTGMRFMRDVRAEANRISWPKVSDTRLMTLMVFVLVVAVGLYLMLVDAVVTTAINWLLGV